MRFLDHLVGNHRSERPDLPLAIAAYPGDIGAYYGHTLADGTKIFAARGTAAAPVTEGAAPIVAILHSSDPTADGLENQAAIYGAAYKYVTGSQTRVQGGLFEAIDEVGGSDSFVEGMRSTAFLHAGTLGSAYGAVHLAQALPGTNPKYVVGLECDVLRDENSDAPVAASFDQTKFIVGFLASSTVASADKPDAGFLVNPLTAVPFRTGFLVAQNSVDDTAFCSRATTAYGLDLGLGTQTQAAIRLPNNTAFRIRNAAGTLNLNVLYVDPSDHLIIGADTTFTDLIVKGSPALRLSAAATPVNFFQVNGQSTGVPPSIESVGSDTNIDIKISGKGTGRLQVGTAGMMAANAAVATVLGSVGPTGASTTVQEWLAVKNSGGTTRFIPCF